MKLTVQIGDITRSDAGAIIVTLFQDEGVSGPAAAVDQALDGAISQLLQDGEIKAKAKERTVVHTLGHIPSPRVLALGLGKRAEYNHRLLRDAVANAARQLRGLGVETIAVAVDPALGEPEATAQAIAEGSILGLYTFKVHKKADEDDKEVRELTLVDADASREGALRSGVERGRILAEAQNWARDLANEPANFMTPTVLAERAKAVAAELGLECDVLERSDMERMGMGALLGVAQGSHQPPKLIVLRYQGAAPDAPALGLVGKGITFDTGGISIKPSQGMHEMKADMAGGADVIATVKALAEMKAKVNVTAVVPATENMPGGSAMRPGDVIRAMNGKTIEVLNTDAEGRLILADALCYARQLHLSPVVDVATLTGAMIIALGRIAVGAMTNNDALMERLRAAAAAAGEKVWQFPLFEEYKEHLKSEVADLKNVGNREAGSITAALFLQEFVDDAPWLHLDIAGVDQSDEVKGVLIKGSTGIPVRTLVNLSLSLAEKPLA